MLYIAAMRYFFWDAWPTGGGGTPVSPNIDAPTLILAPISPTGPLHKV